MKSLNQEVQQIWISIFEKTFGNINSLQDDVQDLKSEIREKDERIIKSIRGNEEMKGKLNF